MQLSLTLYTHGSVIYRSFYLKAGNVPHMSKELKSWMHEISPSVFQASLIIFHNLAGGMAKGFMWQNLYFSYQLD